MPKDVPTDHDVDRRRHRGIAHVAHPEGNLDAVALGLADRALDHAGREVDAVHREPLLGEEYRQRSCAAPHVRDRRRRGRKLGHQEAQPRRTHVGIAQPVIGFVVEAIGRGVPRLSRRFRHHGSVGARTDRPAGRALFASMGAVRTRVDELRVAAVLLAALLGVHQLRYALAFGGDAGGALSEHGHGYLAWVTPLVAALGAFALGRFLVRAAAGVAPARSRHVRLTRLWPAAALALLGLYTGQELLEGFLADGHPTWWAGVAGNGGWLAAPLAFALGGIVALVLRLSDAVESRVRRACFRVFAPSGVAPLVELADSFIAVRGCALARHAAGRAPPSLSV